MIVIIVLIIGLSIYEIYHLVKYNQKKEMILLITLAIVTILLTIHWKYNTYADSISLIVLRFLGMEY